MIIKSINTLYDLKSFAKLIVHDMASPVVILLNGTLGAGKTTFAKFLISEILGHYTDVVSPTFNMLQIYKENDFLIYHYDLYRIENEMELVNLDLDYALENAITIIEWPDIAQNFIDSVVKKDKQISLRIFFENGKRFIQRI